MLRGSVRLGICLLEVATVGKESRDGSICFMSDTVEIAVINEGNEGFAVEFWCCAYTLA